MRVLVTGSSGFVGRHLCRHLLGLGHAVIGFDRVPFNLRSDAFIFVEGNLGNASGLEAVPWSGIDAVFHLGAAGVKAGARDWPVCVRVNIEGTLNLLRCLSGVPAAALVYAHTFYEDFVGNTPALAENPYVVTKHAATRLVEDFATRHPAAVVTAKLFQVYGPGDSPTNLIPYVARQLQAGESALLGSGDGRRDWLHVSDVASGLAACLAAGQPGRIQKFEIGSGELYPIRQVVELLADTMGRSRSLLHFDSDMDRGDTQIAAKAQQLPPDWRPRLTLTTGLADLAEVSA